jgi:hypothetical protein
MRPRGTPPTTSDQCADIWTKALDKTTFLKHRAKLVR